MIYRKLYIMLKLLILPNAEVIKNSLQDTKFVNHLLPINLKI